MGIFDSWRDKFKGDQIPLDVNTVEQQNWAAVEANLSTFIKNNSPISVPTTEVIQPKRSRVRPGMTATLVVSRSFDGEKNMGEVGPAIDYIPAHQVLTIRSWQAFLDSDIAQLILKKFFLWIVGSGLKLQTQPNEVVLKSQGINFNSENFNEITESYWSLWSQSKISGYGGMMSFAELESEIYKSSKVGGDVLVIMRYENNAVNVQAIDGSALCNPPGSSAAIAGKIVDGVEIAENGITHLAYHIRTKWGKYERIPARSEATGFTTAFLVYGSRYRLNTVRGLPVISVVLETIKQMDRYKGAALGSAEERVKVAYQIVHDINSGGLSPLEGKIGRAMDLGDDADIGYMESEATADHVAASTNKTTFNMYPGSKLEALDSDMELNFEPFFKTNADLTCAAIGIPPNIAFSLYTDSFSASRAATKDFDNTMVVERTFFKRQCHQRVFDFWFYMMVITGKIQAPGYLESLRKKNWMVQESYQAIRLSGPLFPHIDPLKEAKAEREKLGPALARMPLTTVEAATEALSSGSESDSNIRQVAKEIELAKSVGIKLEDPKEVAPAANPAG